MSRTATRPERSDAARSVLELESASRAIVAHADIASLFGRIGGLGAPGEERGDMPNDKGELDLVGAG